MLNLFRLNPALIGFSMPILFLFACDRGGNTTNYRAATKGAGACDVADKSASAAFKKQACFTDNSKNTESDDAVLDSSGGGAGIGGALAPLKDDEIAALLKEDCLSCHKEKEGLYASFWSLKPTFTAFDLKTDPLAANVYFAIYNRVHKIENKKPPAMPAFALNEAKQRAYSQLLRWFQTEIPMVVQAAVHRYGGNLKDHNVTDDFKVRYQCNSPVSSRRYVLRLVQDLFNRNPTAEETKRLVGDKIDLPASRDVRSQVLEQIFSQQDPTWYDEFIQTGLKKFAYKVSGANEIVGVAEASSELTVEDLRNEFYEYLKKYLKTKSWREIILQDSVMVTGHTAQLYEGCQADPSSAWSECALREPRGSFFSTAGFLTSKISSTLKANNNYGRVALMHYLISGSVFKPATDGPVGEKPNALPSCLKSNDWRGTKTESTFANKGTMAIPASGNICQSCHIGRQLAAGSILFRPYSKSGLFYTEESMREDGDYIDAIDASQANRIDLDANKDAAVSDELLVKMIKGEGEQACIPGGLKDGKDLILTDLGDLATYLIGDGKILADGLARHIPRALGNVPVASEEVLNLVAKAYEENSGLLLPAIKAYLNSETYACESKEL